MNINSKYLRCPFFLITRMNIINAQTQQLQVT